MHQALLRVALNLARHVRAGSDGQDHRARAALEQFVYVTVGLTVLHAVEDAVGLAQIAKPPEVASVEQPDGTLWRIRILIDRVCHDDVDVDPSP